MLLDNDSPSSKTQNDVPGKGYEAYSEGGGRTQTLVALVCKGLKKGDVCVDHTRLESRLKLESV